MDIFVLFLIVGLVKAEKHILLDSTKESMLDWFKLPKGHQSPTLGWREESFTNFDKGINWRSYVVCDMGYPNMNNWLFTPFIERGDANRIYIEIKFTQRNCDLFPDTALQCKDSFSLLFYELDAATRQPLPWEPEAYKLIDRIAADEGRFTTNNKRIINTETRSVEVNKKGIYIAFRDQGACLSLLAIKVYYKTCPKVIAAFVQYPETLVGKTESANKKTDGVCVANSIPMDDKPFGFCKSDGTWLYSQGGCQCKAGYQMDRFMRDSCHSCPIGKYKALPGEGECDICPPYSKALFAGSVECLCNGGYYRALSDDKAVACTRPPSRPMSLTLVNVDTTTVTLSWGAPRDEGNRSDAMYRIFCNNCGTGVDRFFCNKNCGTGVRFNPDTETFLQTFISIENLSPGTAYRFKVYSLNGVTSVANWPPQYADILITTEPAPSTVTALFVKNARPDSIEVGWRPSSDQNTEIEIYEVMYFTSGLQNNKEERTSSKTLTTRTEELLVSSLSENTKYGFQVRAKRVGGAWEEFTPPVYQMTGALSDPVYVCEMGCGDAILAVVGAVVGVLMMLL